MGYFAPFENVQYKFGGADNSLTIFQNVSAYADILDTFKESFQHYLTYTVLDGDRPDVISAKLYDDPKYYWTFYLMNDHVRIGGWPLGYNQLLEKTTAAYPNTTLVFRTDDDGIPHVGHPTSSSDLIKIFGVGSLVEGTQSGATGTVIRKNLDLGQIVISNSTGTWINGETVKFDRIIQNPLSLTDPDSVVPYPDITLFENARLKSSSLEIYSAHHYENANGEWVDIDVRSENQSSLIKEVTLFEHHTVKNDELRTIKVLKAGAIRAVHRAFIEHMTG